VKIVIRRRDAGAKVIRLCSFVLLAKFSRAKRLMRVWSIVGVLATATAGNIGVSGQVIDPPGGAIPNAIVQLLSKDRVAIAQTKTDAQGHYQFPALSPGDYTLIVVDSAPHFAANSALTLTAWHGWNGSFRIGAINHYLLDGDDPSILASGSTTFDLGIAKQVHSGMELNLSIDNLTNRDFYERQNYFESRVCPPCPVVARIHGTPGYPLAAVAGVTFRLGSKWSRPGMLGTSEYWEMRLLS
jgi:outer membrane receptor protein involved in Fe transport